MSKSIKYTIGPKEIDDNGNETALTEYTAQATYTNKASVSRELTDAAVYVTLPVIADQHAVEFKSDQAVPFSILDAGTEIAGLAECTNLILVLQKDYTYRVKNTSGQTATIVWRLYS